jgi:hypothetical protein
MALENCTIVANPTAARLTAPKLPTMAVTSTLTSIMPSISNMTGHASRSICRRI